MRRDIGYYYEAKIDQVYHAYLQAATNPPFERTCNYTPLHTISFGLNYSFKYNMNGGSCNLHFMPYGSGTAVNIRFSIAQAFGARYEKYAQDLCRAVQRFLPVAPCPASFNMDDFLRPENQVTSAAPAAPKAPAPAPAPSTAAHCAGCGSPLAPNARFCSRCGAPVSTPAGKVCPNCHTQAQENASFCAACGTDLR